jgi:hypothetical protein
MGCCEYGTRGGIHSPSFSSYIMNWPIKLECYFKLDWKGLSVTNTNLLGLFVSYEGNELL